MASCSYIYTVQVTIYYIYIYIYICTSRVACLRRAMAPDACLPMPSAAMLLSSVGRWFQLRGLSQLQGPTIKLLVARFSQLPIDTKMHLLSG